MIGLTNQPLYPWVKHSGTCFMGGRLRRELPPHPVSYWENRLTVSWCGEPLRYAARQMSTLTERWPGSPKAGRSGSTTSPGYPLGGHVDILNRAQLKLFGYPDW